MNQHAMTIRWTARNQGSVLILVVAVLVLMILIGTAYLQAARSDRSAARELNSNNIGSVADACLEQVVTIIGADLFGEDADFLDSDIANPDATTGENDEPYDYPDDKVDPWLADIVPDFSGAAVWKHISNLNGSASGNDYLQSDSSVDTPVTDATTSTFGDNLATSDLADADGDGIADSRWTDAPVTFINGRRYVVCYRIVDLSGMANANVGLSTGNTSFANATTPIYWHQADLELGVFLDKAATALMGTTTESNRRTEIRQLFNYRLKGSSSTAIGMPMSYTSLRDPFYQEGLLRGFPSNKSYKNVGTVENELELRSRGGLNSPDASSQIGELLAELLREEVSGTPASEEENFKDITSSMQTYLQNNPRLLTTVLSGSMPRRAAIKNDSGSNLKDDINQWLETPDGASLATAIKAVLDVGNDGAAITPPTVGAGGTAFSTTDMQDYANQMAACIIDYADADSILTAVGSSGSERFGLEALPFIVEVYRQRKYVPVWVDNGNTTYNGIWQRSGDTAFAVEIRNPYPFDLTGLDKMKIKVGTDEVALNTFLGNVTTLSAGKSRIVYYNHGGGDPRDDLTTLFNASAEKHDYGAKLNGFEGDGDVVIELKVQTTASAPNDFIAYQKFTTSQLPDGDLAGNPLVLNEPESTSGGEPTRDLNAEWGVGYKQRVNLGNGNDINAMLVTQADSESGAKSDPATVSDEPLSTVLDTFAEIDALGDADKTGKGGEADQITNTHGTGPTARGNQILFSPNTTDDKLMHIGELAQITFLGPTASKTFAQQFGSSATTVQDYMLDMEKAAVVSSTDGPLNVPWPMVLLDRFTTARLDQDAYDADGDGDTSDEDVAINLGLVNINTAPLEVLKELLPIAAQTQRHAVAELIHAYRSHGSYTSTTPSYALDFGNPDEDTGRESAMGVTDWRSAKGIANVGELFPITRRVIGDDATDNNKLNGRSMEYTPPPIAVDPADAIVDDREEQNFLYKWLSQMTTTRSDRFAAYIVVRSYDVTQAIGGVGEWDRQIIAEERRIVAIIDRSNLASNSDRPRILAWQLNN